MLLRSWLSAWGDYNLLNMALAMLKRLDNEQLYIIKALFVTI